MGHYAYFKDIKAEENGRDDTIHIVVSGRVIGKIVSWEPGDIDYPKIKTLRDGSLVEDTLCPRCGEQLVEKDSIGFSGETFKVLKCVKPGCGFCK